jgi:diguanylate cyclase (GGDEF)-like protein/PAS domain S-box-containing protein
MRRSLVAEPAGVSVGPVPLLEDDSRLRALQLLSDVSLRVASSVDLSSTLHAVADAVTGSLGFDAAVLNLVREDAVDVVAVSGPDDIRSSLMGTSQSLEVWEKLLNRSTPMGGLRFIDGRTGVGLEGLLAWVPDIPVVEGDAGAWHPHDALFAPLAASTGELLGVLSVDMPRDGRRPDGDTVALLERFALMAALAIDRARVHKQAADTAELFRRTFDDAPLGMALLHLNGCVQRTNAKYAELAGRPAETLAGAACWDLVHADDREAVELAVHAVAGGQVPVVQGDVRDVSGLRWGRASLSYIKGPEGPQLLVQMLDVTEEHRATAALKARATTDVLTGLQNRAGLSRHLEALLARPAAGVTSSVAVVFCDLDLFKLVNDTHGHAAGDELLVFVASSIRQELRGGDIAARFGGDEFVLVLDACEGPAGAVAVAERVRSAICRPVRVGPGTTITPSVSMGIVVADHESTAEQLLADADTALYRAKESGRGRWELFEPTMRDVALSRLRLREALRQALVQDQLRLHYQPIVALDTGRTLGFEALLRWEHPEQGLLLPAAFLDELMQGELAASTTDWVVSRALAEAARWPAVDGVRPFVSVNVGPEQLTRADLPAQIASALRRTGVSPDRLWIEVTEEALLSAPTQIAALASLRSQGVHIALDDFGSGYAGLLALRDVPADIVKLDRAFTRTLHTDATTHAIVAAVAALCRRLDLTLLAEGLEEPADVTAVQELGVTLGQGYHLGRPGPLPS